MSTLPDDLTERLINLAASGSRLDQDDEAQEFVVYGPYHPDLALRIVWSDYCKTLLMGVQPIGMCSFTMSEGYVIVRQLTRAMPPTRATPPTRTTPSVLRRATIGTRLSFVLAVFYRYVMEIPGTDSSTIVLVGDQCYSINEERVMTGQPLGLFRSPAIGRSYRPVVTATIKLLKNTLITYLEQWLSTSLPMTIATRQRYVRHIKHLIRYCELHS